MKPKPYQNNCSQTKCSTWMFRPLAVLAILAVAILLETASAQTLQFKYAFEDGPGTTTTNDPGSAIYPLPLNMLSASSSAVDLHGSANSGIQNQGMALNLFTNPIAGNAGGAFAMVQNSSALGALGIVSSFTATVWINMSRLETNILNQGSRVYNLMGTAITDIGGVNSLGFQPQLANASTAFFPKVVMRGVIGNTFITPALYYDFPTNEWLFFAMTYDSVSGNASLYYGTEASPAKLYVMRKIGAGTNFNFSGTPSFSLGDRPSKGRSFPGGIDDARFYTGTSSASFIEGIRQSGTPVVVSSLVPDGSVLMGGTNTLSFAATSANGVNTNGIQVLVNGVDVSSNLSFTAITGGQSVTYTNLPVNPLLILQTNLNAVRIRIKVTDAGGIITSNQYVYDAFSPNLFTWEGEDYDYNGGQYTDNPTYAFDSTINPYYQAQGQPVIDYYDNGNGVGSAQSQVYRSISDLAATEFSVGTGINGGQSIGELMRQKIVDAYALTNVTTGDADLGNFDSGASTTPGLPNWVNYTRTYPTGTFNVFIRAALGGTSGGSTLSQITSGWGTTAQTSNVLGTFSYVNTGGWEEYAWIPLKDTSGNLVRLNLGGTNTFQLRANTGGGGNVNFLMLAVANTNLPVITGIYPNGTNMFQPAASLTFVVNSPASFSISTNTIKVQLTVTSLLGQSVVTNITSTNGLSFSGSATNWNVSCPLTTNSIYTAVISAVDVNGGPASSTVSFDTINPSYTWEAVDYDYFDGTTSGLFFDNPQINSYAGLSGQAEVDFHDGATASQVSPPQYRTSDPVGLELNGDKPRLAYIGTSFIDYDVGYNSAGDWGNYTRTYPAGQFNVYLRAANGSTSLAAGAVTLSQVTSGLGTASQTTTNLGTFATPSTGSGQWQNYTWSPLRDSFGNLVKFTGGSVKTLRATITTANQNDHFYALFPANTNLPALSGFFPAGHLFQSTNTFGFNVQSSVGVTTNSIVVTVNGVVINVTNLVFSGSSLNWNVSYPHLQPNTPYTVSVLVTDINGNTTTFTSSFDTFSPSSNNNYTWEGEDFDYDGGQFIDNPQTNAYLLLAALTDVDTHQVNFAATAPYLYRTNALTLPGEGNGMATEINGDVARSQFNGTGFTDYTMGFFSGGSWANYTRHYPAGSYNVYGRLADGAAVPTSATLSQVTSGWGTTTQTTNQLGTFTVANNGWETYAFCPLRDGNGNPVTLTFDGTTNTLQVENQVGSGADVNVNFFMLVPQFVVNAAKTGTNISLSFLTQSGFKYQVQYKTNLLDPNWSALGGAIAGTNGVTTVTDPATGSTRFYRALIP